MHPYENIPLNTAGYILAAWLICLHLWMLTKPTESKDFFIKLPRNKVIGPIVISDVILDRVLATFLLSSVTDALALE